MREEGNKYRSFWPTLATVAREEGRGGLYRGLLTQLIRQIPNTAVMMATYELTVHFMTRQVTRRLLLELNCRIWDRQLNYSNKSLCVLWKASFTGLYLCTYDNETDFFR